MVEITLRDGTVVRCRPVPAYATTQAVSQFMDPPMATVGQATADGRTEYHPAAIGSPQWAEYEEKRLAIQKQRVYASRALDYDYGVISWSYDDGALECSEPPKGWVFPKALAKHGVESTGDRRTDYIAFELLADASDHDAFQRAIGDKAELTPSEVEAAMASFPGDVARGIVSRVTSEWGDDEERVV